MIPLRIDKSKLDCIKIDFKKMIKIGKNTKDEAAIINKELDRLNINERLDDIILADFDILLKIKTAFDTNKCIFDAYEGDDPNKKYVKDSLFNNIYKAYGKLDNNWLINELGITVCPYCNRDFINNRGKSTSAQLDHFFPRSRYPIFAVSLFNLIPSCYACNHIKLVNEIAVSPYNYKFDYKNALKFSYTPLSSDYLNDHKQLKVDINIKQKDIYSNIKVMRIDKAYELHADYVQELIKKSKVYNKVQILEYLREYPGLFSSKEELLRIIFGNYIQEKDFGKRPLAKLTVDILEELGINLEC
ncbi:HNH endonuclease domain-containing protein [Desulfosporosinus sp. HMP52]|uniref:HNH endonuclease n=1 Tax=Desulfosporosinus sp. HMP52 TaxID=1487923 RepID=UPI0006914A63|nr:HNH endonuclease domain-containing protein [Desulfosporosinus sp. HMP52]